MLRKLLFAIQGKLPTRHITHQGHPYLERSYVATLFGVRVYLHRFVACDEDGLHDHPFRQSLSLILAGWYFEDRWAGRTTRRWLNYIGPNCFHRVVLPAGEPHDVWTLFLHTKREKGWGFLRPSVSDSEALEYRKESLPEDPAYSSWHLKAPTGKQLREHPEMSLDGKSFHVPLGLNAYAAGLLAHPES